MLRIVPPRMVQVLHQERYFMLHLIQHAQQQGIVGIRSDDTVESDVHILLACCAVTLEKEGAFQAIFSERPVVIDRRNTGKKI